MVSGEGGIRTHEGLTPTRFRIVRNQPDSATSPTGLKGTQHSQLRGGGQEAWASH